VNAVDAKGATALHLAVSPPYADKDSALEQVVAVLLERGADPNLRDTGQATPLHRLFESASAWHQGVAVPPQYAVTNQLLSATLEQRIRKALGRL